MPESASRPTRVLGHGTFAALSAELIANTGGLRFRAHGRSMHPFIRGGDVLVLTETDGLSLRVGEVVLFQTAEGGVRAHRIIGRTESGQWVTRGDALLSPDPPIEPDRLIGRVVRVERGTRSWRVDGGRHFLAARLWMRMVFLRRVFRSVVHRLRTERKR